MKLEESNFLLFAMHSYDTTVCHSLEEFEEDLKKFLYLRKLILRYKRDGELKERLILNHLIVLYNIFGDNTLKMLFFKIETECWPILITFLVYLNRMPAELPEYGITLSEIELDPVIVNALGAL
jgi:hypothetical protein